MSSIHTRLQDESDQPPQRSTALSARLHDATKPASIKAGWGRVAPCECDALLWVYDARRTWRPHGTSKAELQEVENWVPGMLLAACTRLTPWSALSLVFLGHPPV